MMEHENVLLDKYYYVLLEYEIRSSWWASKMNNRLAQSICGMYFAWKTRLKYDRYIASKMMEEQLRQNKNH